MTILKAPLRQLLVVSLAATMPRQRRVWNTSDIDHLAEQLKQWRLTYYSPITVIGESFTQTPIKEIGQEPS